MTRIRDVPRENDERILRWLWLRLRQPAQHISTQEGIHKATVTKATKAVAVADATESGEDVRAAYPWWTA